jgi:protein-S-isoprenylcysteine O-methyltransferase Ste14
MMRATDFEFRHRWWFFGVIFGASFSLFVVDHVPAGARLADHFAASAQWPPAAAERLVFGVAALLMVAAALVRTWGSAYLGRDVVHGGAVRSEALRADGPYRHVRNPLYLGNILMAFAMGAIAPVPGSVLMLAGIWVFCLRLIGREEAALESELGERYRSFVREVPRLWPSLRVRIPAGGNRPDWTNGLSAEAYFWSFALGAVGFALSLDILWLYGGFAASPVMSWLAGVAFTPRRRTEGRHDG